ncbi:MAG: MOSC domain-containing protein, partial [Deltaproteobacteria bacterium]|nr:MOSC domain-containing protein [Deltaproteobacteria bacterium]
MSGGTDFTVAAVCRAVRKGIVKTVDPEGGVLTARGLEGDAHAGAWH